MQLKPDLQLRRAGGVSVLRNVLEIYCVIALWNNGLKGERGAIALLSIAAMALFGCAETTLVFFKIRE